MQKNAKEYIAKEITRMGIKSPFHDDTSFVFEKGNSVLSLNLGGTKTFVQLHIAKECVFIDTFSYEQISKEAIVRNIKYLCDTL